MTQLYFSEKLEQLIKEYQPADQVLPMAQIRVWAAKAGFEEEPVKNRGDIGQFKCGGRKISFTYREEDGGPECYWETGIRDDLVVFTPQIMLAWGWVGVEHQEVLDFFDIRTKTHKLPESAVQLPLPPGCTVVSDDAWAHQEAGWCFHSEAVEYIRQLNAAVTV